MVWHALICHQFRSVRPFILSFVRLLPVRAKRLFSVIVLGRERTENDDTFTNTEEEETWIPATVPGEEKRRSREQRDSDGRWAAFQTMIAQNFFYWVDGPHEPRTNARWGCPNATSHSISCLQRPPTTQSSSPYHFDSREIFFFLLAILLVLSHCQGTLLKGNSRIRTLTQREKWINIDLVN